ncbi:uncharacterized protein LOC115875747 [Sitophilus oryzae]|uniref:Uncharacterized protein LOC115875747 n=1 Tax=Sitophilus oryzae TaxID=7048 RepID=A0A6J2X805_SITOR|nr:uncharacterized protein LOC115875747 [Sitophilus oryzae]
MSFVSSESEESDNESVSKSKESDVTFVAKYVRDNPIILNKWKTPAINKKKQDVLDTLKQHYENNFGKPTNSKKLLKKINNLKAVVKKTDANITGNKKKKLSAAEQFMYTALQGDQEECNPVLFKIPGHVAVGIPSDEQKEKQSDEVAGPSVASTSTLPPLLPARPKRQKIIEQYETEETRTLSTTELQRLVLLKQLHVLNLKKAKLEKELNKDHVLREGEKTYTML